MFGALLKEHQREQEEVKAEINNKRIAAERAVDNLTVNTIKDLNEGIAKAYLNQHQLDNQVRKLQGNVARLTKQSQQWMTVCHNLNSAVKDLGDVTTWIQSIENDVKYIAATVGECRTVRNETGPTSV